MAADEEILRQLLLEGTPQDPAVRDPELDPLGPAPTADQLPLTIEERFAATDPIVEGPVVRPNQQRQFSDPEARDVVDAIRRDAQPDEEFPEDPQVQSIGATPPPATAPALRTNVATGAPEQNPGSLSPAEFANQLVRDGVSPQVAAAIAQDPAARARFDRQVAQDDIAAEAQRRQGEAESQAAQANERLAQERQQALAKIQADTAQKLDELAETKVDPERKWKSLSTGRKVGMLVATVMSGLSTPAGGRNSALEIIDRFIERDIQAQRDDIATKRSALSGQQNLYNMALQQFGSQEAAVAATKAKMYADISRDAQQQLAKLAPGARAERINQLAAAAQAKAVEEGRKVGEQRRKAFLELEKNRRENEKLALERAEFGLKARKAAGSGRGSKGTVVSGKRIFGVTNTQTGENFIELDDKVAAKELRAKLEGSIQAVAAADRILARGLALDIPGAEMRVLNDADSAVIQLVLQDAIPGIPSDKDVQIVTNQFKAGKSMGEILSLVSVNTRRKLLESFKAVQEANLNRSLGTFGRTGDGRNVFVASPVELDPAEDPSAKDPAPDLPPPGEKVQAAADVSDAKTPEQVLARAETLRELWANGKASVVANSLKEASDTVEKNFSPVINELKQIINNRKTSQDMRVRAAKRLRRLEKERDRAMSNAEILGR